ncbi:ankyrin repeat-containing domain protein [Mycena leptocephala]|nr:ankyrin repeat-containing domain protein [Mycena leptocephala]
MSQKQHDTENLRKEGTGNWFLEGNKFVEWKEKMGSLWIEGPSGAGKTVLRRELLFFPYFEIEGELHTPAIAFFYFDFRSKETQSVELALRRIVLQLSAQSPSTSTALHSQYKVSNGQRLPSYEDLVAVIQQLLRQLGRTHIILDALDECNEDDFDRLVAFVSMLQAWTETPLHLLITSQTRQIFTKAFERMPHIALEFDVPQEDIKFFIASELETKSNFKFWRRHADHIIEKIAQKSKGMFRLATCLLVEVSRCRWEEDVEQILENLPNDLFAVYDRFLERIPSKDRVYVEAILRWTFYFHSDWGAIIMEQLADAIAFDFTNSVQYVYKPTRRERNIQAISDWLEGLVVFRSFNTLQVELAHASVQDYILSKHFSAKFELDLSESVSHTFIARTCISYLLHFRGRSLQEEELDGHPLAEYAARNWCYHLLRSHDRKELFSPAIQLLDNQNQRHPTHFHLLQRFQLWRGAEMSPLHLCSFAGYREGILHLLSKGADINLLGYKGSPLMIASRWGNNAMVCVLLNNNADVNLVGGKHGSALAAASSKGHIETIHLLLRSGADINLACGEHGGALATACHAYKKKVVRLLLENGADVNLPAGKYGSLLTFACYCRDIKLIASLLEYGADVNLPVAKYGSALATAASENLPEALDLLVGCGADVDLAGGKYGSALGAAAFHGSLVCVEVLLDEGADINMAGGKYGNALAAASRGGHKHIVEHLLEGGADVNLLGGKYGSALATACYSGHFEIVHYLLDHGASVNSTGGEHGSALASASYRNHRDIVQLLLDYGADMCLAPLTGLREYSALSDSESETEADTDSSLYWTSSDTSDSESDSQSDSDCDSSPDYSDEVGDFDSDP